MSDARPAPSTHRPTRRPAPRLRPRFGGSAAGLVALLLAGCANYDFSHARTPGGGFDIPKLIADLKASGKDSLSDGIWIPLIYLDLTTFGISKAHLPDGYELVQTKGFGPLFVAGSREDLATDEAGATIEESERHWVGWGLLFDDHGSRVETPHGARREGRTRLLGVFGWDDVLYLRPSP